MNKKLVYLTLGLVLVLYQNFTLNEWSKMQLNEVNESSRVLHAKELLGKYYKKSVVKRTEGVQFLNIHIYNKINVGLPKAFKKKSNTVAQTLIMEAEKFDFDPVLILAVIETESTFNPLAVGTVGELGLMQIRPETAEWIAKKEKIPWKGVQALKDPAYNVRIGIAYLAFLRDMFENKAYKYISAYNVGPGKMKKVIGMDSLPRKYSTKVMTNYEKFYAQLEVYSRPSNLALNQMSDVLKRD